MLDDIIHFQILEEYSIWLFDMWPFSGPAPTGPCPSGAGGLRAEYSTPDRASPVQHGGGQSPPFDLLVTLLLMQRRTWLAFWAASAYLWLMLSFVFWCFFFCQPTALNPFPQSCFQTSFCPSLYLCLGLPWPGYRTLHLALLNFMRLAQAHLSSLSRSLWVVSLPPVCLKKDLCAEITCTKCNAVSSWGTPVNKTLSREIINLNILYTSFGWNNPYTWCISILTMLKTSVTRRYISLSMADRLTDSLCFPCTS